MKSPRLKILVVTSLLLCLMACGPNKQSQLAGNWQMTTMKLNGTTLTGNVLQGWLWTFDQTGHYTQQLKNMEQKGIYQIKNNQLLLKRTEKAVPVAYIIVKLDSLNLTLNTSDTLNQMQLMFVKAK